MQQKSISKSKYSINSNNSEKGNFPTKISEEKKPSKEFSLNLEHNNNYEINSIVSSIYNSNPVENSQNDTYISLDKKISLNEDYSYENVQNYMNNTLILSEKNLKIFNLQNSVNKLSKFSKFDEITQVQYSGLSIHYMENIKKFKIVMNILDRHLQTNLLNPFCVFKQDFIDKYFYPK